MCSEDLMIGSKMSEFHLDSSAMNSPLTSSFIYATPIPPSISIENQNGQPVGQLIRVERKLGGAAAGENGGLFVNVTRLEEVLL